MKKALILILLLFGFAMGLLFGAKLQKNGTLGKWRLQSERLWSDEATRSRNFTEESLLEQIWKNTPPKKTKPNLNFKKILGQAIGYSKIETGELKLIGKGESQKLSITVTHPILTLNGIYREHKKTDKPLIVYLHGLFKSANSELNYYRGKNLFNRGFDVLALDLSTRRETASAIHSQLTVFGIHLDGLWAKTTCDTVKKLSLKKNYSKVILYGFSNGGFIAQKLSVLCSGFDLVIVDDILDELSELKWKNINASKFEQYRFYYLAPLARESSLVDYFLNAQSPTLYTRYPSHLQRLGIPESFLDWFEVKELTVNAPISFFLKENDAHDEISPEIVEALILGKPHLKIKGFSLFKKNRL